MQCRRCSFDSPLNATECPRCGVVFAKLAEADAFPELHRKPVRPSALGPGQAADAFDDGEIVRDGTFGKREALIMGGGLAAAFLIYLFPLTRFLMSALVTLFHECGHAAMAWLLGMPSIPAFDFTYGGGITHYGQFHLSIVIAIGPGFAYLAWCFRHNWRTLLVLGILAAIWLFFVSAPWRRELACEAAGHLSEFILSSIFFYMALAGVGFRNPDLERPLGAFVAFFVQIHSVAFAMRLRSDPDFLAWYREGKGGMLMNDLEAVALDLRIHFGTKSTIESVAGVLMWLPVILLGLALIWYFNRARCHRFVRSLLVVNA